MILNLKSGGSRISHRRGCKPINWPIVTEKCTNMNKFWAWGGGGSKSLVHPLSYGNAKISDFYFSFTVFTYHSITGTCKGLDYPSPCMTEKLLKSVHFLGKIGQTKGFYHVLATSGPTS